MVALAAQVRIRARLSAELPTAADTVGLINCGKTTVAPASRRLSRGWGGRDGWPIQAWCWLEWGSSTAGQSLPAARSRLRAVHSDSIFTRPPQPVAYWRKLLHSHSFDG